MSLLFLEGFIKELGIDTVLLHILLVFLGWLFLKPINLGKKYYKVINEFQINLNLYGNFLSMQLDRLVYLKILKQDDIIKFKFHLNQLKDKQLHFDKKINLYIALNKEIKTYLKKLKLVDPDFEKNIKEGLEKSELKIQLDLKLYQEIIKEIHWFLNWTPSKFYSQKILGISSVDELVANKKYLMNLIMKESLEKPSVVDSFVAFFGINRK